ncbi:hypothetical protein ACLOJK_036380, partial [Asimina triloba]
MTHEHDRYPLIHNPPQSPSAASPTPPPSSFPFVSDRAAPLPPPHPLSLSVPAGLQGIGDDIIYSFRSGRAARRRGCHHPLSDSAIVVGRVAGSGPAITIPSFPLSLFPPFPLSLSLPALLCLAGLAVPPLPARARARAHEPSSSLSLATHHPILRSKLITDTPAPFFSSCCCPTHARLLCLTSPATGPPPTALLCLATRQSPPLPCLLCLAVAGRHLGRRHKLK